MKPTTRVPFALAILGILLGLVALLFLVPGVFPAADARYQGRPKVIVLLKENNSGMTFWKIVRDGAESAADDVNLDLDIRGPDNEKAVDQQIEQLTQAIREKPAAIVLAAADFLRLVPGVQQARRLGIPVVTMDSFIATGDAQSQIGTDSVAMGAAAAASLLKFAARQPEVAILSHIQGSSTARDREQGAQQVLAGKATVLPVAYSGADIGTAYRLAKELLDNHPNLGGILALNEPTTQGVIRALRESGRAREIPLVGIDQSFELLKGLEEGVLRSLLVQQPFNMGYLSVVAVRDLLDHKPVSRKQDTGSIEITKENMFLPVNEQRLFPFDAARPLAP
jgi:ribose transport system substrate-binding protein